MVIAARFHLFPFRTEKLSSLAPMVLRFSRGRVGSRLFKPSWYFRLGFLFVFTIMGMSVFKPSRKPTGLNRRHCRHNLCYPPLNPPPVRGTFVFVPTFMQTRLVGSFIGIICFGLVLREERERRGVKLLCYHEERSDVVIYLCVVFLRYQVWRL